MAADVFLSFHLICNCCRARVVSCFIITLSQKAFLKTFEVKLGERRNFQSTHCGSLQLHIQKLPLQYLYSKLIMMYLKLFTSLKHFDIMMNATLIIISSVFLQHILKLED